MSKRNSQVGDLFRDSQRSLGAESTHGNGGGFAAELGST